MATILLVEDENSVRDLFSRVLQNDGHRVIACSTLTEGRQTFGSIQVGLVVTDERMPDGNGADWAEELYAAGQAVLIVSGTGQPRTVPVLRKPIFRLTTLTEKVRELLGSA